MTIQNSAKCRPLGPNAQSCAHMAYVPKTEADFDGDIQHDVRDDEMGRSLDFLAQIVGQASQHYLRAASLTGQADSALVDCLLSDALLDAQVFFDVHWLLARYWRKMLMRDHLRKPCLWVYDDKGQGHIAGSYIGLHLLFVKWGLMQIDHWAAHFPQHIRLICLVSVYGTTSAGRQCLAMLMHELRKGFTI